MAISTTRNSNSCFLTETGSCWLKKSCSVLWDCRSLWIAILYINHISTVFYSHLFTLNLPASWLQSEWSCKKSKYILGQSFQIRVAAGPNKDNVCGEFQMLLKSWNIAHWLYSIFHKIKNTVFSKVWCRDALYIIWALLWSLEDYDLTIKRLLEYTSTLWAVCGYFCNIHNLPRFLCHCPNKLLSDDFQGNGTNHCHHCLRPVFSFQ